MGTKKTKLFILIPDGVSLRNFAYTSFYKLGVDKGYDIVFWNNTPFDLEALGYSQERLIKPKLHWLTSILKSSKVRIELSCFEKRTKDPIYKSYLFPLSYQGWKNTVKSTLISLVVFFLNSEKGSRWLKQLIPYLEQKTSYFNHCKTILEQHQPDLVYCCSQRSVLAIAPLQAAKKLGIVTCCFIYSWDNLPKATLDVPADYYNVWSNHMKKELLFYYPFVKSQQVIVTGTPQFEPHAQKQLWDNKTKFFAKYGLDDTVDYLCYSGDDFTTSPKDELYLRDVAQGIRNLNNQGYKFGLIFRRCPVDFSDRYNTIIEDYQDVILPIAPVWKKIGGAWDTILPTQEDTLLLAQIAAYSIAVINLGSSMVFDFAIHNKPCFYMNYNYLKNSIQPEKNVHVYTFVHFRSMPNKYAVIWLNHPDEIAKSIVTSLEDSRVTVTSAKEWYNKINQNPSDLASVRIWDSIEIIIKKEQS